MSLALHAPIPRDDPRWREAAARVLAELEALGMAEDVVAGVRRRYAEESGLDDTNLVCWDQPNGEIGFAVADLSEPLPALEVVRPMVGLPRGYMSLRELRADALIESMREEIAALRAPDPAIDALPVLQLPLREGTTEIVRQVIGEHRIREADPGMKQRVEDRRGRPRDRGMWLAYELFDLLRVGYAGSDAERFRAIADTLAALDVPIEWQLLKNRLFARAKHRHEHLGAGGPEILAPKGDTDHARAIREALRQHREARERLRRL